MYDQSIQIRPRVAGARDPRTGNVSYSWPAGSYWTLERVMVAPAFSNETDTKGRTNEVITGIEVYTQDSEVNVKSSDRAWYAGEEWQVNGRVGRWGIGAMFRLQAVSDNG